MSPTVSPSKAVNITQPSITWTPCKGEQVEVTDKALSDYKWAFFAVSDAYRKTMYNIAECNIRNKTAKDHEDRVGDLYDNSNK